MSADPLGPDDEAPPPSPPETVSANQPEVASRTPPVVGIGASAGGLEALTKFFSAMPPDSGLAFVVVPHLDPTHASLMVELLSRQTRMPVSEATEGTAVRADQVYLIPPNKYLTLRGGALHLTGPVERRGLQTAVDIFLRSLAEDRQENAIAVILSGTGTGGTLGLRAVKEAGGMALVQDPKTAEQDRMPLSAIATGLVDYVLPPEQMPAALVEYVRTFYARARTPPAAAEAPNYLSDILDLLRAQAHYDFRCYRQKMLRRRVERRMALNRVEDLAGYFDLLCRNAGEVKQLAKDLLISVTSFFRDPEAFQLLERQVVPALIRGRSASQPVRVWSAGCATGEEPYALAMLLWEQFLLANQPPRLKVYASDVDEDALEFARQGRYPESIVADLTPERLQRFFVKADDHYYRVNKQLRETVIFAVQNLILDAPFSKLDLICCRNLLIYLDAEVQQQVIALFHFALNEGGVLFLGPSESIGRQTDLFEPLSKKWRVYRRIGLTRWDRVRFPLLSRAERERTGPPGAPAAVGERPVNVAELADRLLLQDYAPAAVLVNRKYEVLYFHGPTGRFLDHPTGMPTRDVMLLAREGMSGKLRAAVHQAVQEELPATMTGVQIKRDGAYHPVQIRVTPVKSPRGAEGLLLITFQDEPAPVSLRRPDDAPPEPNDALVRQLEYELQVTQEDLQSSIEEMMRSNEELKASNEEIMSINEELQSANEEMETSKEELQSLNEELSTVNAQLQDKVEELERTNNDLANLLSSTDVVTVFLDRAFRIKRFTPASTRLLNMIAGDVGRPLGDIAQKFDDDQLLRDAELVLQDLIPRDREVQAHDGRWCLRRVLPYRTLDQRIEGVVITFTDVTQLRQAVETRRLATILKDSQDALTVQDFAGTISAWNRGAEAMYGYAEGEALGLSIFQLVPEHLHAEMRGVLQRVGRGERVDTLTTQRRHKDGHVLDVWVTITPLRDESGRPELMATTERDVTERRRAEEAVRQSRDRLSAIVQAAAEGIITVNDRGVVESFNRAAEGMFGHAAAEVIGRGVTELLAPPYGDAGPEQWPVLVRPRAGEAFGSPREVTARRKDGRTFPAELVLSESLDGSARLVTAIVRDLSVSRSLEQSVLTALGEEQRRIGAELHDNAGQELTGLALLAQSLAESLQARSPADARAAARLTAGLKEALAHLREVARGLMPVELDEGGLMAALGNLAARTGELQGIACTFACDEPVYVADNNVALHVYRIAQEAVTNALKHARPKHIRIALTGADGQCTLRVADDGDGFAAREPDADQMGLRILRYRAGRIGGRLEVGPGPDGGTEVRCTFRQDSPHGQG